MSECLYRCECHGEGLIVDGWEGLLTVALFSYQGWNKKDSLWDKIKCIYNLLVRGEASASEVVLDPKEAKEFGLKLVELADKAKKEG